MKVLRIIYMNTLSPLGPGCGWTVYPGPMLNVYGINILSLVSTASLRNWFVFFFLEERKEKRVPSGAWQVASKHQTICKALAGWFHHRN